MSCRWQPSEATAYLRTLDPSTSQKWTAATLKQKKGMSQEGFAPGTFSLKNGHWHTPPGDNTPLSRLNEFFFESPANQFMDDAGGTHASMRPLELALPSSYLWSVLC